jgi:uncharacterized protein (DUF58 family)
MMVRREEQPWHTTATLLLDTRSSAHRGDGPASSFEWAVSAAASAGVHLGRSGYITRLLTDTELDLSSGIAGGEGILLDFLAEVRPSKTNTIADGIRRLRRDSSGLVVAITGFLSPEEAQLLGSARPGGTTNIAVLVDAASWVNLPAAQRAAADERYNATAHALLLGGWRVLRAKHGTRLDQLWPYAATRGGQGMRATAGPITGTGVPS